MYKSKIMECTEIVDAGPMRWELIIDTGETVVVDAVDNRLGNNVPEVNGYIIPCFFVCKNDKGLCIKKNPKYKIPCEKQFFYFRKQR